MPEGRGTAAEGREVYARRCARCHGPKGEGGDEPKQSPLVGGRGSLKTPKPLKTVGSYWPYAPSVWDYVNRAMPLDRPGTLTHNQVYSLVAFIFSMNGIIGENDVLDAKTLAKIRMPNRDGFVPDARPDVGKKRKSTGAATLPRNTGFRLLLEGLDALAEILGLITRLLRHGFEVERLGKRVDSP